MVMAICYLVYSAYFLSLDFEGVDRFMKGMMALLYMYHTYQNINSIRICRAMLKEFQDELFSNNPNDLVIPAIKEKQSIMK